jgi:hypothetical protein
MVSCCWAYIWIVCESYETCVKPNCAEFSHRKSMAISARLRILSSSLCVRCTSTHPNRMISNRVALFHFFFNARTIASTTIVFGDPVMLRPVGVAGFLMNHIPITGMDASYRARPSKAPNRLRPRACAGGTTGGVSINMRNRSIWSRSCAIPSQSSFRKRDPPDQRLRNQMPHNRSVNFHLAFGIVVWLVATRNMPAMTDLAARWPQGVKVRSHLTLASAGFYW